MNPNLTIMYKKLPSTNNVQRVHQIFKKCFNKHILIVLIAFSCFSNLQANTTSHSYNINSEWTLLKEVSGIMVYYKINKCESQNNSVDTLNFDPSSVDNHDTFALKFVNNNATNTNISFSKTTTTNGSDEMESINLSPGITILQSCQATAKLILTQKSGDHYPISVSDFLQDFKLTTNN